MPETEGGRQAMEAIFEQAGCFAEPEN